MQNLPQGHQVLSLFGMALKPQALNKKANDHSLAISLISAFFIVLAVGLILGISTKIIGPTSQSLAVVNIEEEKVAFEPGQIVSKEITRGYFELR